MKVIIVGSGPAGLISALYLIQEGIRPVILEKRSTIKSTACAEVCGLQSISEVPFNSNQYICKEVKGVRLFYADDTFTYMSKTCVTLDRTYWLKGMAQEVVASGGQVKFNSEVVAVDAHSIQLKNGERIDYDVLLGADGPNSCIARHLGIRHKVTVGSQYKLAYDTSSMDYMEFYIDKRFSPSYSWIVPKDGSINVGLEGNFTQLDAFLRSKGLSDCKIIRKEAGIVPVSGIQKLVQHNIALIGDAAAITNPISGGGLTPIIHASQIFVRNIHNLENYEREVKKHPISAPVLVKTRRTLIELADKDVAKLLSFLTGLPARKRRPLLMVIKYPSLILKFNLLRRTYQALRISKNYGW